MPAITRIWIVSAALLDSCWLMIDEHNVWNGSRRLPARPQGPCFAMTSAITGSTAARCCSAVRTCCWIVVMGLVARLESRGQGARSEEHTSELQSLMRTSYAVFCLKKKPHSVIH